LKDKRRIRSAGQPEPERQSKTTMNPEWRFALSDPSFWERLVSPRALGLMLWTGLAVLTVALVLLLRTRWGQTKPLSKCVALSVFAHILFLAYASGTKLVFDHPGGGRDDVLPLALVGSGDQLAASSQQTEPWDESFAAAPAEPDVSSLPRRTLDEPPADETPAAKPPELPAKPEPVAEGSGDVPHETAPVPAPTPSASAAPKPAEPAAEAVPETIADEAAPKAEAAKTEPPAPSPANEAPGAEVPQTPPQQLLSDAERLQHLTDISIKSASADAAMASPLGGPARAAIGSAEATAAAPGAIGASGKIAALLAAVPVVRRLGDTSPLPDLFKLRNAPGRSGFAEQLGGSPRAEEAVQAALSWLAANQEADGHWDAARHGGTTETKAFGHDRQSAGVGADAGITGLAILAFLGSGNTHYEGPHRKTVQRALEYLISVQSEDGCLSGDARLFAKMYCHGIATLAMCESLAMTGDHRMKPYVVRAIHYTIAAQHEGTGGWRYQPGDQGDTSQLGWQILAIRSAQLAGIDVPARTKLNAQRFLATVSSGSKKGLASYRAGEAPSRSMTAEALLCRLILHQPDEPVVSEAVGFVMGETPGEGPVNMYYWYYATLALFQVQGDDWQRWNAAMQEQLLRLQSTEPPLAGSWDPDGVWGGYGGRVYSTALAAMCLEVYYRYLPILGKSD
jgi:hypothetical protein